MNSSIRDFKEDLKEKGIYINSEGPSIKNALLSLEPLGSLSPPWLMDGKSNLILFPVIYKSNNEGEVLVFFNDGNNKFPAVIRKDDKIIFNFDPLSTVEFLTREKYLIINKLFYKFLPADYHLVPGNLRRYIKRLFILIEKRKPNKERFKFPSWPVETAVETINHIFYNCMRRMNGGVKRAVSYWPKDKSFALVLSHDIDTAQGFKNIDKFVAIEKRYNMRSCWFVVGKFFESHRHQLSALRKDGFEIGCHGYLHDNKLTTLSRDKMRLSLDKCACMLKELDVKGFRSPSLLRSSQLFEVLEEVFLYDTSIPDTESFLQIAPRSGCCTTFPFRISGNLLELPITLPLDSTLLALRFNPEQVYEIWKEKLGWIKKLGGMAHIVTHAESYYSGNTQMLKAYEQFINFVARDSDCWMANPTDVALWSQAGSP